VVWGRVEARLTFQDGGTGCGRDIVNRNQRKIAESIIKIRGKFGREIPSHVIIIT